MKIIWLEPQSGYVTDLRSVTLWGSLCWGIRYLFGETELENFIERCHSGKPDFVLSSAFPFKQVGKEKTPFFPNLLQTLDLESVVEDEADVQRNLEKYRLLKKLKKIQFLSQPDFEKMLAGELTAKDLFNDWLLFEHDQKKAKFEEKEPLTHLGNEYLPDEKTIARTAPVRHNFSMTHNTIDRLRGGTLSLPDAEGNPSGQLFHANDIWWSDPHNETESRNTGLFFLVEEIAPGSVEKYLAPVLRFWQHRGFGADNTTGKGFFKFKIEENDFRLAEPEDANAVMNLSLFIPNQQKNEHLNLENAAGFFPYSLENRESWGSSHTGGFPKNPQLFFAEGSIFPASDPPRWQGCIQKNTDAGHAVWDNGFGFMVKLKWNP